MKYGLGKNGKILESSVYVLFCTLTWVPVLLHTDGSNTLHTLLIKYYIICRDGKGCGRGKGGHPIYK